jgi:hypothetical protein
MEATTWSAPPMASTPSKPNTLTAARHRNGSARGSNRKKLIALSPRDSARPQSRPYYDGCPPSRIDYFLDAALLHEGGGKLAHEVLEHEPVGVTLDL